MSDTRREHDSSCASHYNDGQTDQTYSCDCTLADQAELAAFAAQADADRELIRELVDALEVFPTAPGHVLNERYGELVDLIARAKTALDRGGEG